MRIQVNGENKTLEAPCSVAELLQSLGHQPQSVAVAMDGRFVPRSEYATVLLAEGQALEVLAPMQGG